MQQPAEAATDSTIRCVECDTAADNTAAGSKAYLGGGLEGEALEVVVFCPGYAAYEFSDSS